jgi:hypothetical protein
MRAQNELFQLPAKWVTHSTIVDPPFYTNYYTYYYTEGDTLIHDTLYVKCYGGDSNYPAPFVLLRSEEKATYYRLMDQEQETLFFDADVSIGDSIEYTWFDFYDNVPNINHEHSVVAAIDSFTVDNTWRNIIITTSDLALYEGIGHTWGFVCNPTFPGLGFDTQLNCYSFGDELFSSSGSSISYNGTGACQTPQNVTEKKEVNFVKVFPNPCSSQLQISTSKAGGHFYIHNTQGQLLFSDQFKETHHLLDTFHFTEGLYSITIEDASHKRTRAMFEVIQD